MTHHSCLSHTHSTFSPTFIPPLLSRGVGKLQINVPILSSLRPVLAVRCSLVGLVVNLTAECMGELFCSTSAFLTQVVALSEVLAQVLVITVESLGIVLFELA